MPFTAITPLNPVSAYGAVTSGALHVVETACDSSNGNKFPLTGKEVLVLRNTDSGAQTVTINSVADSKGRTGDITTYSIPAGETHAISFRNVNEGWAQTDSTVHFTASSNLVKAYVLTAPN